MLLLRRQRRRLDALYEVYAKQLKEASTGLTRTNKIMKELESALTAAKNSNSVLITKRFGEAELKQFLKLEGHTVDIYWLDGTRMHIQPEHSANSPFSLEQAFNGDED